MAKRRKPSESDARRRILDAAIVVIDLDGDSALRMIDVADRAGVAPGLINHHFGSRDGLVAAAQAERYAGVVGMELDLFRSIFIAGDSREATIASLHDVFIAAASRDLAAVRLSRASALGSAHGRPDLEEVLSRTTVELIDRAAEVFALGQETGIIRRDVDPRAAASVVLSLTWGFGVIDFDTRCTSPEETSRVVLLLVDSLLAPEA